MSGEVEGDFQDSQRGMAGWALEAHPVGPVGWSLWLHPECDGESRRV